MELRDVELPQPNPQVHCPLLCPRVTRISPFSATHPKLGSVRKPHMPWPSVPWRCLPHLTKTQGSEPQKVLPASPAYRPHGE